MENKTSVVFAAVGGLLLIIAGAIGGPGIWGILLEILKLLVPITIAMILDMVLLVLNFVALFGGIVVIIGGILIGIQRRRSGKFIISLGSGSGLIGFIIQHVLMAITGTLTIEYFILAAQTPGFIGIIISIIAVMLARKPKEPEDMSAASNN